MFLYATTRSCRQLEILDYFGDPSRHVCGTCDNCAARRGGPPTNCAPSAQAEAASAPDNSNLITAIRIVLSGVARMKGRYGKQMVARMLVGSKAKELTKYKLNSLSTFGLLSGLSESQISSFIDALLSARLLQQVEDRPHRPLVRLTP